MKASRNSMASDAAFVVVLTLVYVCVAFMTGYSTQTILNTIAFACELAIVMVTLFTSLTAGLVVDLVVIFGATSYLLYRFIAMDDTPANEAYFWIVMLPLLTVSAGMMSSAKRRLEAENLKLREELNSFVTVDELTGLKNIHAFENDMQVYANISRRNSLTLALLAVEFRYAGELRTFLGDDLLREVSVKLSQMIGDTLRGGDTVYLLSRAPYRWGALLLMNADNSGIVADRIRTTAAGMEFGSNPANPSILPEIRIGVSVCGKDDTPRLLLERAVKNMEYDV